MSPAESRKRLPEFWQAYDTLSALALDFASGRLAAHYETGGGIGNATIDVVNALDTARDALRDRIEADAAEAGKVVPK